LSRTFQISHISDIASRSGERANVKVVGADLGPATSLTIPAHRYGDRTAHLEARSNGNDHCEDGPLKLLPAKAYLIENCVIWSKYGLVFVGDHLIKESLFHFPKHLMPDISFEGEAYHETSAALDVDFSKAEHIDTATTCLAGIQENYYHWMMFVIGRFSPKVYDSFEANGTLGSDAVALVPSELSHYQAESLKPVTAALNITTREVSRNHLIRARNLIFPVIFPQGGLVPNPLIRWPIAVVANALSQPINAVRKIYVSRRDSQNRVLKNEAEVEALLKHLGFEIVVLSGMTLAQQISIFASATHIISPHGAGLTNIVFCLPGTKILEIHAAPYVNWCYLRLSALYNLEYGFIFGAAEEFDSNWVHNLTFKIPLETLMHVLVNERFLAF